MYRIRTLVNSSLIPVLVWRRSKPRASNRAITDAASLVIIAGLKAVMFMVISFLKPFFRNCSAVPVKGGKGLRIATFCVLSVIAAALVSGVVIQALSMSAELKHYKKASEVMDSQKKYYDENAKYYGILDKLSGDNGKVEFDEPDGSDYIAPKSFSDGTVRKVGETYTFDYGTLTLKSVKPVSEMAADSTKQMAALTLTVTNTTDKKLSFIHPKLSVGDTEFDGENYLFSESGSNEFSLNSGESASFVFYYKLPKENQKLDCNIAVYSMGENGVSDGSEYEFSAAVLYQFETKDVK